MQLLLIVRYIAEWARDTYRPVILEELERRIPRDSPTSLSDELISLQLPIEQRLPTIVTIDDSDMSDNDSSTPISSPGSIPRSRRAAGVAAEARIHFYHEQGRALGLLP